MRVILIAWWQLLGLCATLAGLAWWVGSGHVSVRDLAVILSIIVFGIWTTPKTWSAVVVTVADLNLHVRDNLNILKTSIANDGALIDDTAVNLTVTANTITANLATGRTFDFQATANITTTTLQNVPTTGHLAWFVVRVKGDGTARSWTFVDSTVKWGGGFVPIRTATVNRYDWFLFLSLDGGTTWAGNIIDQNFT